MISKIEYECLKNVDINVKREKIEDIGNDTEIIRCFE